MSIATELTLLANSKQAIKNSINAKGGSITDSTPFADYSTAIDNLPSGGSGNPLLTSIDVSDFTGTDFDLVASYITDVTIPSGVVRIGGKAFQYCSALTNINIPSSVCYIENTAFNGCTSLTSVIIPNTVKTIGISAFNGCTSLTSVIILGDNIETIGNQAFKGCTAMSSVIVNATTPPTLGSSAFDNTNDCPIYVPAESVDAYKAASGWSTYASRIYPIQQVATVDGNPVYNYEIGDTDGAVLGSSEMANMPTGTSLELAEGITSVQGVINGYTTVSLPSTMSYLGVQEVIGSSVMTLTCLADTPPSVQANNLGGSGLTAIYVPVQGVNDYKASSGWSTHSSIIQAVTYRLATLTLSDNTEVEITSDTPTLTRALVSTPYSATLVSASIAPDTTVINDRAFYNCTLMTSVTFESGSACETIYTRAFYGCSGLTSITLPNTVTSIGDYAFVGTALTSITIPDSVAEIGSSAFMSCESLENVTIGSGLTDIGETVFGGCESLTSVTMLGETPPELEVEGADPFGYGDSGINTLYVPAASVSDYQTWVEETIGPDTITVEAIPAE